MTLTTHAAAGILLSGFVTHPAIAFLLGAGSHYVLDVLPHGDEFLYWRHVKNRKDALALLAAACDLLALTGMLLFILSTTQGLTMTMTAGVIGAILPDIFTTLHTKNQKKFLAPPSTGLREKIQGLYHLFLQQHYKLHMAFHNLIRTPIRFRTGIAYQLVALVLFLKYYLA